MRAKDFRQSAWTVLSGRWGTMILIVLVVSLILGACSALSWIALGAIILVLVSGPLYLGQSMQFLKLVRGQRVEFSKVFDGFKNYANAFLLYIINTILIALWSLLLVIPGIIKSYAYSMSYYILADNPTMDANTARVRSMGLMRGNKWRLFCLDFSFIGWYILCGLTFGILSLWIVPYHNAARAVFYREILREQGIMYYGAGYSQQSGNVGGFAEAEKSKSDGEDGATDGAANGNNGGFNGNVNGGNNSVSGVGGASASVFGSGYTPDPFAGNSTTPEQSDDEPSKSDDGNGGKGESGDGTPPINADDL